MAPWDNKSFWNDRYSRYPTHGSGPGSRGFAAWYKNKLIKTIVSEYDIRSIIDIGFGDLCWLDEDILAGRSYAGFDISDVAVKKARSRYPSLHFEVHDIANAPIDLAADLIVNFDVLIHQLERHAFDQALANTLIAIKRIGLISYLTPPLPDGTFPASFIVNDPSAQQHEAAWQAEREQVQSDHVPKGSTFFHEALPLAAASIRDDMEVAPVGHYRYQTIYAAKPRQL